MKYMGSKNRIAKHILPIILQNRTPDQWYVEPFVGGGNIIDKVKGKRIGSDSNKFVSALLDYLSKGNLPEEISKEKYQSIKKFKGDYPDWLVGYAGICCSYSGKWFGGFAGEVDTKCGIRNYQKEALANIEKQSLGLVGATFKGDCYQELIIPPDSIIYCDIPYAGTTKYKDSFDHPDFWQWCREKGNQGHTVFISEYSAPDDFICVWQQEVKSSLSANGKVGGNKVSIEKLFVHKSQVESDYESLY